MSKLDLGNNEFINYEFHENEGKDTIVFSNSGDDDHNKGLRTPPFPSCCSWRLPRGA